MCSRVVTFRCHRLTPPSARRLPCLYRCARLFTPIPARVSRCLAQRVQGSSADRRSHFSSVSRRVGCSDGTLVSDHVTPEGGKERPPPEESQRGGYLNGEKEASLRKARSFQTFGLTPTRQPCFVIPFKMAYCVARREKALWQEGTWRSHTTWT